MELQNSRAYVYDRIPTLKQMLPTTAGIPGVEYAIVTHHNLRRAQDEGWSRLHGNQKIFTIEGPKGSVDCELFGRGTPIVGQDPTTGKRVLKVDKTVYQETGHSIDGTVAEDIDAPNVVIDSPSKVKTKVTRGSNLG